MAKHNTYRRKPRARTSVSWPVGKMFGLLAYALAVFMVLVGVSWGLVAGYRWATSTELFALQQVQVSGAQRLDRKYVLEQAGLDRFQNLVHLSLWKVRRSLQQDAWIKSVTLERIFPHTLRIRLQEKVPVFWRQQGDRIYYADKHGEIIAPVRADGFVSLPLLVFDPGLRRDQRDLALLKRGFAQGHMPLSLTDVAWVRFQDNHRVELMVLDRAILVVLGRAQLRANAMHLTAIWRDVRRRGELDHVERIMVFAETGWVGYRSSIV